MKFYKLHATFNFHVFENLDLTKLPFFIDGKIYKVYEKTSI